MDERELKAVIVARNLMRKNAEEVGAREQISQDLATEEAEEYRRLKLAAAIKVAIESNLRRLGNDHLDDAQEWNIRVRTRKIVRALSKSYYTEIPIYGWPIGDSWQVDRTIRIETGRENPLQIARESFSLVLCTNGNFYICKHLGYLPIDLFIQNPDMRNPLLGSDVIDYLPRGYQEESTNMISGRDGIHVNDLPMECLKIIAEDWGISVD